MGKNITGWPYIGLLMLLTGILFLFKSLHQSGAGLGNVLAQNWPLWFFWLLLVPGLWWLSGILKLYGPLAAVSFLLQILIGFFTALLFICLMVILNQGAKPGFAPAFPQAFGSAFQQNILFASFVYWANTSLAYVFRFMIKGRKPKSVMRRYDNSILIKTSFGYVLVEIVDFKYVKDGGRKILFETDRSTPLNRNRVQIQGTLVEQDKYRNDRNIVINLAKIRRAVKRGEDEYVFFIGFSHEVHLNKTMYLKLGGWLPRPVVEKKPDKSKAL